MLSGETSPSISSDLVKPTILIVLPPLPSLALCRCPHLAHDCDANTPMMAILTPYIPGSAACYATSSGMLIDHPQWTNDHYQAAKCTPLGLY